MFRAMVTVVELKWGLMLWNMGVFSIITTVARLPIGRKKEDSCIIATQLESLNHSPCTRRVLNHIPASIPKPL